MLISIVEFESCVLNSSDRSVYFLCVWLLLQVDMSKVNVDTIKPWIAQRVTALLGLEDDVIVEFVYNQLEERVSI